MEFHHNQLHKVLLFFLLGLGLIEGTLGLGVNWGLRATHPLPANIVVKMMKDNGFNKVKLFEADHRALKALGNSGIQVMVGIPNELLEPLAANVEAAIAWVSHNISTFVSHNGVDIRYVAVGNEPFLKTYGDKFVNTTFPALQNIQAALIKAGLGARVKATIPLNADVYQTESSLPSGGDFRYDIRDLMVSIVKYLSNNGASLMVNIYPFLSLNADPNFPVDYAFFDGNSQPIVDGSITYTNVFEANYDTLIFALEKNGYGSLPVIVGEVGWPTDADPNANNANAKRFNQGLINRIIQGKGTPKRPTPPDVYIFSLLDEDAKSIDPGNFERHWGMFNFDGSLKYQLNMGSSRSLVPAKGVKYLAQKWCVLRLGVSASDTNLADGISYACQNSDCTSLGLGSSCSGIDAKGNASYAFNMYYQTMNQSAEACQFNNLATTTTINPSQGSCRFEIQIDISKDMTSRGASSSSTRALPEFSIPTFAVVVGWIHFAFYKLLMC
ncbi:hypothetical protein V2J09_001635 [Rumex salicifolius]